MMDAVVSNLICPWCWRTLLLIMGGGRNGEHVLRHDKHESCPYSEKFFTAPTLALEGRSYEDLRSNP